MLCPSCTKLALLPSHKKCVRCQSVVFNNLSVLCDACSKNHQQCAVCLKKVIPAGASAKTGCGCGGRK